MSQSFSGPMAPLTTTQNLRALPGARRSASQRWAGATD